MSVRKNTLVVDFSGLPKRPDAGQVQQFLEKKVQLNLADTKTIQLHNLRNCVYIETIDSDTALRYEKANNYKHTVSCNNKEFKIPIYVDSEAVTVRVHDLPTHTPHRAVTDFMGQFGVVISIARERWKHHFPGFFNGVRVLRMRLSRSIPSVVEINGDSSLVTYRNQPKTCYHCGEAAHPKQKCAKTSPSSNAETSLPPGPAKSGSSGTQLDGVESPSPTTNENENIKNNNTTSDNGDDCDGMDDDGEDDGDDGRDDGNSSSDSNGFIEATNRKRRMSKKAITEKANEMKKKCVNQGRQNTDEICNRYEALVEINPICPSPIEMSEYLNRSRGKTGG